MQVNERETGLSDGGAKAKQYESDECMLKLNWYPQCCTAKVINSFSGSENSYEGANRHSNLDFESIYEDITKWIKWASGEREALLTAVTTNTQEQANLALEHTGFTRSEPIINRRYPTTFLYNWYLAIHGYTSEESIDGANEYIPLEEK